MQNSPVQLEIKLKRPRCHDNTEIIELSDIPSNNWRDDLFFNYYFYAYHFKK